MKIILFTQEDPFFLVENTKERAALAVAAE